MIFKILFNIVGFGTMILMGYFQFKLFMIAASLRNRNKRLLGKGCKGRFSRKQLLLLVSLTDDAGRKSIHEALNY